MTTTAEVKRMVQPLLARHDDLALVGRLVVVKPVRHIIRGVFVDREGSRFGFRPIWAVNLMFEYDAHFSFNFGEWLYPKTKGVWWDIERPGVGAELCAQVEEIALPQLRQIDTLEDFFFCYGYDEGIFEMRKIVIDAACGNFESADRASAKIFRLPISEPYMRTYREDYARLTTQLCPLVAVRDRAGIAALLHGWEADAVKKQKLTHLWEPSPFPVEIPGGDLRPRSLSLRA